MIVANIKRVFSLDQGPVFMFLPCQYLFFHDRAYRELRM